jgi:hypothetical protein
MLSSADPFSQPRCHCFFHLNLSGEVAKLFADAGLVCIASLISPYRSDRSACRDLLPKHSFIEVYYTYGPFQPSSIPRLLDIIQRTTSRPSFCRCSWTCRFKCAKPGTPKASTSSHAPAKSKVLTHSLKSYELAVLLVSAY